MRPITDRDNAAARTKSANDLAARLGRKAVYRPTIIDIAADVFGVRRHMMTSASRYQGVVRARFAAMMILYDGGRSSAEIGRMLGGMDHTSVLYGIKRARGLCVTDADFSGRVDEICRTVTNRRFP